MKTTRRRPLQAGEPWLCMDTGCPHAMCDAAFHATFGQCASHQMLSLVTNQGSQSGLQKSWTKTRRSRSEPFFYPGKDRNPYAFEHGAGQMEELSWHEHGRAVEMIEQVCRKRSRPPHTIRNNYLIMTFRPRVYDKHVRPRALCVKKQPCVFLHRGHNSGAHCQDAAESTGDAQSSGDGNRGHG